MKRLLFVLAFLASLPALAACGGGGILGAQRLAPLPTTPPKPGQASEIIASYVNTGGASGGLVFFAANANGNVSPSKSISGGGSTSFTAPIGMAQDQAGNVYVLDSGGSAGFQVLKYAAGSEGGTPVATIGGSQTGMQQPTQLAVDKPGNIYIADSATDSISMFAQNANGNVAPSRQLSGPATQIGVPSGLATDPVNDVYVTSGKAVLGFDPSLNGNAAPTRVLAGFNTGLTGPGPLTFAADGTLFVETTKGVPSYPQIEIFTALQTQNVPPELELGGITTQLTVPTAIAVDGAGFIYISNGPFGQTTKDCSNSKILVYEPGANGNRAPIQVISGSNAKFGCITGLAVR